VGRSQARARRAGDAPGTDVTRGDFELIRLEHFELGFVRVPDAGGASGSDTTNIEKEEAFFFELIYCTKENRKQEE